MSANNMSDEELDKLFRKSAEHYEPPFDEEAWKAMDRKLDGAQGGWLGIKRMLPVVLLPLLVTVAVIWRTGTNSEPATNSMPVTEERSAARPAADRVGEIWSAQRQAEGDEHLPAPEPDVPAALYPAVQTGSGAASPLISASGSERLDRPAARAAAMQEPLQTVETVMPSVPRLAVPQSVAGIARQQVARAIPADSGQAEARGEQVFLQGIRVALVVAPDITTVRFKDPDAVSANAGVLFSVPITKRLSLVSGAVWANKRYNATPADYAPSPDYWDGRRLPDVIAAQCRVLDIPVNLQYQVLGWGKNMLSVQAGLSSYLMLNEEYTYTYQYSGREPYSKTLEFSNENRHWFGIQNVSVGYTHQLSPAFSIGAEPFVKIPLASIGEGRVKLTSAGVFFTAGFTFR
jgi:hypothetical protein